MAGLAGYMSIGRPTDDADENLRRAERKAFNVVLVAMTELSDRPLGDELGVVRARQRYAFAKANWATALQDLDAASGIRG